MSLGRIGVFFLGLAILSAVGFSTVSSGARAESGALMDGGRLLGTAGVSQVEGAAGGGIVPWATIAGYGTRDALGASAHGTLVVLPDFQLRTGGVAVGLFDRVEISYARQSFDTRDVGAALGLGRGFTFDQDVVGAKVRVAGNAVYDQDSLLPQVAIGAQWKRNNREAVVRAVGARSNEGIDYYVAATKVLLAQSLVVDGTLRLTRANQFGLIGFGGDRNGGYQPEFEGSLAYLVSRHLAVGGEYRMKPDNLSFAREDDAWDVFAVWFPSKRVSLTAAFADLGSIAGKAGQRGAYASIQVAF
jgi:hypothetical protein